MVGGLNKYETAILRSLHRQYAGGGEVCDLEVRCADGQVRIPGLLLAAVSPMLARSWDPGKDVSDVCVLLPDLSSRSICHFLDFLLSPAVIQHDSSQQIKFAIEAQQVGNILGFRIQELDDMTRDERLDTRKYIEIESWEIQEHDSDSDDDEGEEEGHLDDEYLHGEHEHDHGEHEHHQHLQEDKTPYDLDEPPSEMEYLPGSQPTSLKSPEMTITKRNPEISLEISRKMPKVELEPIGNQDMNRRKSEGMMEDVEFDDDQAVAQDHEQSVAQDDEQVDVQDVPSGSENCSSSQLLQGREVDENYASMDDTMMQDPPQVADSDIDNLCVLLDDKSGTGNKKNLLKNLLSLSKVDIDTIGNEVLSNNFSDQEGRLVCLVCYKIMDPDAYQTYRSHVKEHDTKQLDKVFIIMPEVTRGGLGLRKKIISDKDLMKEYMDKNGDLVCTKCPKKFNIKEKQNLKRHLQYHQLRDKKYVYVCSECNRQFNNPSNLNRHVKQVHERQIFRCLHCDFEDKRKDKLETHLLTVHKDKGWIYDDVPLTKGLESQELGELGVPLHSLSEDSVKTPFVFKCSGCHFRRRTREGVADHIKEVHHMNHADQQVCTIQKVSVKPTAPRPLLRCDRCDAEVTSHNQMLEHKVRVHDLDVSQAGLQHLVCKVCGITCATKSGLKAHDRTHQEKKFTCSNCDRTYFNLHQLREHVHKGHCREENRKCKICHKIFYDRPRLEIHMKIHNNVRDFKCDQCDKTFVQKRTLKEHYLTHSPSRKFECKICLKKFVQQNHLKYHLSSQHPSSSPGETKHKCGHCSKAFPFEYLLRKHQRVHGKVANNSGLQCDKCSTWFSSPILLKDHQQQKKCLTTQTVILQQNADGQITSFEINQLDPQFELNTDTQLQSQVQLNSNQLESQVQLNSEQVESNVQLNDAQLESQAQLNNIQLESQVQLESQIQFNNSQLPPDVQMSSSTQMEPSIHLNSTQLSTQIQIDSTQLQINNATAQLENLSNDQLSSLISKSPGVLSKLQEIQTDVVKGEVNTEHLASIRTMHHSDVVSMDDVANETTIEVCGDDGVMRSEVEDVYESNTEVVAGEITIDVSIAANSSLDLE